MNRLHRIVAASVMALSGAGLLTSASAADETVADQLMTARAADGRYISWREHLIDDEGVSGVPLRGSDGLVMADLDGDGHEDIVSVHESDDVYDGAAEGHIRIAFGSADPDQWQLVTLAEGPEAGAAEDAAIADVNGDGYPDIVAACELAHLIYFQNPGDDIRSTPWKRVIPPQTQDRGSFIRVFLEDLNGDGRPEIISPNKGAQDPTRAAQEPRPISVFEITGAPLDAASWQEHELTRVPWPINAQPVDLDGDGDADVVGGSVAQGRMMWFENRSTNGALAFVEHTLSSAPPATGVAAPTVNGFNMDFADLNGDGRLDILTFDTDRLIGLRPVWLEQPADPTRTWPLHVIGDYAPDLLVGLVLADIDSDGDLDVMSGGYSLGNRLAEEDTTIDQPLGRLAWFENPGDAAGDWTRHDISRRKRGMFDKFVPRDMDGDGDIDFVATRGNAAQYDGVFWLEQQRSDKPKRAFTPARKEDSAEMALPSED